MRSTANASGVPDVRLQPRRPMVAAAAVGCKPMLDGVLSERMLPFVQQGRPSVKAARNTVAALYQAVLEAFDGR
jgi:hypothetical protein